MPLHAWVSDAHEASSVTAIRALGRTGLRVGALAPTPYAAGLWSRYAARRATGPDPAADPGGFARAVARAEEGPGPVTVFPGREESLDALLHARSELPSHLSLPYPDTEIVQRVRDKRELPGLARAEGIATPRRLFVGRAGEVGGVDLPTPCVFKPMYKGTALGQAQVAHRSSDVQRLLSGLPQEEMLVVESHESGPLCALVAVVARDGQLVAAFQQRARRTWPREAGPSAYAVSVQTDEALAERIRRMLAGAGYWGLAQVQFLESDRGPVLIDVNPRLYGSLALALAAGVNLPALWLQVARGGSVPDRRPHRVGVAYRWMEADLYGALHGKPAVLLERPPRPRTGPMWAGDDPIASLLLGTRAGMRWVSRQAARAGASRTGG